MTFGKARRQRGPQKEAGFTLIELLVALTLFGLLSVALVGGLRFGARVWERGHEQSAAFTEVEAVQGVLRQLLEQARLSTQVLDAEDQDRGFVGGSDRIEFLGPLPQYVGLGGVYRFSLSDLPELGIDKLVLSWKLYRPDQDATVEDDSVSQRILLEDIEEFQVRYYGAVDPDAEPEWHEEWGLSTHLPGLISVELSFPPGDLRTWPEFVLAPIAGQDDFTY